MSEAVGVSKAAEKTMEKALMKNVIICSTLGEKLTEKARGAEDVLCEEKL